jgi:hypothetical protein
MQARTQTPKRHVMTHACNNRLVGNCPGDPAKPGMYGVRVKLRRTS